MYIYLVTSYDKEDNPNFIADFTIFMLWSVIELNIAMIICCMPVCGPVAAKTAAKIRDAVAMTMGHGRSKYAAYDPEKDSRACLTDRSRSLRGSASSYEMGTCHTSIGVPSSRGAGEQLDEPAAIVVRTDIFSTYRSP